MVGTGDCLHPLWFNELKDNLIESSNSIFYSLNISLVYFILETEVELIWKDNFKIKKVHFIIFFPNFEKVEESIEFLAKIRNIAKEVRLTI